MNASVTIAVKNATFYCNIPNSESHLQSTATDIVGSYALLIMDNLAKRGWRSGVVEDVAVSPKHQGRGIGRALARERCHEAGCYKFILSSGISRDEARAFYDALGLKRHGFSFLAKIDSEGPQE